MARIQIVNVGIDTIRANVKYTDEQGKPMKTQTVPDRLERRFVDWQEQAKAEGNAVPTTFSFHGVRLMMQPYAAPSWKYVIDNDCIHLELCPRLRIPALAKVTWYSPYLWSMSTPEDAVDEVHAFLIDLFGQNLMLQPSQLDLCVDVVNFKPPERWRQVFISRARRKADYEASQKDRAHYFGRNLETVYFSGHGRPVSAKLYDKTLEISQQANKKDYFHERWKRFGWNGTSDVWRVEFSLERAGLHEMDLEDLYDALRNTKRLWDYCTQTWLRMVTPDPQ